MLPIAKEDVHEHNEKAQTPNTEATDCEKVKPLG